MLKIRIETKNSAFDETEFRGREEECARILRDVAQKIIDGQTYGSLFDINGNNVGSFNLSKR